ncbi:multicopper oxidase family protein [Brevibacillus choshinensis]|uniref:Multicopper oxidase family protein n=1 Tax=Brevibacillus choshinensis TaxID=54911 RepID=A0ABX7FLJ1_BRECH|nr:multicopper oxidase family protein [Brevibacillus choshinensis]QRG67108.1 multicopper oxidase family protein [Brevibacillus choshinensis]
MPDFEVLAGVDQGLYLIFFLLTLLPALQIRTLVHRATGGPMTNSARWILCLTGLALLVVLGQWGSTWHLYESFGWPYIKDKALGFLPLSLFPAFVAALVSVPRLWRLSVPLVPAKGMSGSDAAEEKTRRHEASAPEMIVPIQALSLGAFLAATLQFILPSVTLQKEMLMMAWGVLLAGSSALWIWQSWQQQRHSRSGPMHRPHLIVRFLQGTFVLLFLTACSLAGLNSAREASLLPERMSMTNHTVESKAMQASSGGHAQHAAAVTVTRPVSVTELTGPQTGAPDRRFTLTAQKAKILLPSGKVVEAWTYNGRYPGPELRAKQGELIEVVLENKDISEGVTIHWHGLNVPNAEDGVAGATQDAVLPGEKHVYRFVAEQSGTFWYHSHQQSSVQVKKGLLGALVIEPAAQTKPSSPVLDLTLVHHKLGSGGGITLNGDDGLLKQKVLPGTSVRLRLINADSFPAKVQLQGASFQVAAIDGNEIHEPNLIANQALLLAAGGRYDVTLTMPNASVFLAPSKTDSRHGLLLSPDGTTEVPDLHPDLPTFDPASYGSPQPLPFDLDTRFDRDYRLVFDVQFGFYDGKLDGLWTINGKVFPHTPMLMAKEGDLVKMTFINRSYMDHPMHLHGHHMLVLSRNGAPTTGSPWWTDTLNVAPGETYEVAFRADNPGLWMDHCHNLTHAAMGMTMHLLYEGVTSPFQIGHQTRNQPE